MRITRSERQTLEMDAARIASERERMDQAPYDVLVLLAAHVRITPVPAVVEAEVAPERVLTGSDGRATVARDGSGNPNISAAIQYVAAEQGEAMAVFQSKHQSQA